MLYRIRHETGKPASWDWFEATLETLDIMNDAELMAAFRRGVQDFAEGRVTPWEDVKRELNRE